MKATRSLVLIQLALVLALAARGVEVPRPAVTLIAANQSATPGHASGLKQVPFVGCASDGQMGPIPAPEDDGKAPALPRAQAQALAYYSGADMAVLAPRGWHCFGLDGSNGSFLTVTPEAHNSSDLLAGKSKLVGPAIQLSYSIGDTSGRFEVARIAARLFPTERAFVQKVIDEKIEPAGDFPFGPYPSDSLTRRSATEVDFVTPAHRDGLGTMSRLRTNADPIAGMAILLNDEGDEDLMLLDIRLPPKLRRLIPTIMDATRQEHGDAATH